MSGVNINELTNKIKMLQQQAQQLQQLQNGQMQNGLPVEQTPAMFVEPSYPRTIKTETVDDILNNPKWRKELELEFTSSDLGKKANHYAELLFHEYCEKATGKPSIMLDNLRNETKEIKSEEGDKNV